LPLPVRHKKISNDESVGAVLRGAGLRLPKKIKKVSCRDAKEKN
jgi:hypothetical protein